LRNWFAGINDREIDLSQFKNVNDWLQMIHKVSHELSRVLKKGGYLVIEVGEVRRGKIKLEEYVWKALENLPFKPICVLINQQNFTKTSNCWGVGNNHKGTNTNRIVVAQKI
jgi:ubiquinone/menaquinone biosynthesis C-methylase UbiE